MRAAVFTVVGWLLLLLGVAALVLPGPGLLLILAGLIVLSNQYEWAERRVLPMRRRAFQVARASVSSWHRILMSVAGTIALFAAGVIWWLNPTIPTIWIFGPKLPGGGWAAGSGLILSGFIAVGLIAYSFIQFRVRGRSVDEVVNRSVSVTR